MALNPLFRLVPARPTEIMTAKAGQMDSAVWDQMLGAVPHSTAVLQSTVELVIQAAKELDSPGTGKPMDLRMRNLAESIKAYDTALILATKAIR